MQTRKTTFTNKPFTVEVLKMQDIEGYVLTIQETRVYETDKQSFVKTLKQLREVLGQLINQLAEENNGG